MPGASGDVVGLYLNPPDQAVVLCMDEKSQIQALDRTQPSLPIKKGRAGTMTHDYKRHGTTNLFAALNVLTGVDIGQCLPRHLADHRPRGAHRTTDPHDLRQLRHPQPCQRQEMAGQTPAVSPALHPHLLIMAQSGRTMVRDLTAKSIRRGIFHSANDLITAIEDYLKVNNDNPKPFVWTATAERILAKVARGRVALQQA
jgi:hypothetical protein